MAYNNDQNEPKVPVNSGSRRESSDLLPRFYRTSSNKKFLQATLDQLIQPGTVKKINGYVGQQTAKAVTSDDIFIAAADTTRQNYQFEPSALVQDYLGNVTFFKDYIDHVNHIGVFDGITDNHSRLNKQEFYSWNPHIDWDKFVNYQEYYWLPFGPDTINVFGNELELQSTYTVKGVDESDNVAYLFTPNGLTRNPVLRLFRGQTYTFEIDAEGHPFSIKTSRVAGSVDRYTYGVSENAVEKGTITFTVPNNAPDVLFYVSENAVDTGGVFKILNIEENTAIDVEADILGKKSYVIPNGTSKGLSLSNGMKIKLRGIVTPEVYANNYWYVEGVGTAITLTRDKDLEVRSSYNQDSSVLFDDTPFDQLPFGDASTLPSKKDYVTINRSSPDNNPWSRYNRWFHKDVIIKSAEENGVEAELDQLDRAIRPIIEFQPGIKLHNYGLKNKQSIDVIDTFTTDVFSTIEGSLGYNIDGIDLADNMRVMFTADPDIMVKNKIFNVNFIDVTLPEKQLTFTANSDVDPVLDRITFTNEHGLNSGNRVTYLNNGYDSIPGLEHRQVYYVKVLNPFAIELHRTRTLNKITDITGTGLNVHKLEVFAGVRRQITLTETEDSNPIEFETVTVNYGTNDEVYPGIKGNQGQTYWYNGNTWKLAQLKTTVNQSPLFDVFDINGNSFNDTSVYDGSSFTGTKIFSYKIGTGTNDSELGFPLSYKNINNIGDIVFQFNLLIDTVTYKNVTEVLTTTVDKGYLKLSKDLENFEYSNAWIKNENVDTQPIIRVFKDSGFVNNFPIDVYSNKNNLDDLEVRVYINGKRLDKSLFNVVDTISKKIVNLNTDVSLSDVVTLRCFSSQVKNNNGYYEIPLSLQNNPLNENIDEFTLGQVIDHVDSIIDNLQVFEGQFPGNSNIRDLGQISQFGTKFIQHSGPMNLSLYHLGSKNSNIVKALDKAREDYGKFKRAFIVAATESGIDTDPRRHVDYVLQQMFKDKPKSSQYYLSDMFGYTASNRIEYTILDYRIKTYPLTRPFGLNKLSNKSVNIYINGEQLVHGKDYVFGNDDVFFEILRDINDGDLIEAYEYENTDGCFVPPTPTKLGLYPKYEPMMYVDDTYLEPTVVIQGHDGSITVGYGDYRDELLLELEKRIFNNIKVEYDPSIFDIYNFIPGYNRNTSYSIDEFNKVLAKYFYQWTSNIQQDYTEYNFYDQTNSFTYNYRGNYTSDNTNVPSAWRGIYKWLLDTDRPHTHPWECLGFSLKPHWWEEVYGPAPYTSDNLILWEDLKLGLVKEPGVPVRRNDKFARPILNEGIPVNELGQLISPKDAGLVQGLIRIGEGGYFVFGDQAPVESAWRRSSYYPFAFITTALLLQPNDVLGRGIDRSRIIKNLNDQLIYSETGLRIRMSDLLIPSTATRGTVDRVYTAGLINYVVDFLTSENTFQIDNYENDLKALTNKMSIRLGSFTSKEKYKILLDSKTPSSSGGVFVPEENYFVDLNVSSAVKKIVYSGILVTKTADGFEIRGYNFDNPYFNTYKPVQEDRVINVGGISESYVEWAAGRLYVAGKLIRYSNQFYRVVSNHTSGENFDSNYYVRIAELPVVGGREATLTKIWDREDITTVAYGTKFTTIQEVVDLIQGYGEWLKDQGFVFDDFNNVLGAITNWETSVKEFLFWTTQGWAPGSVISLSPAANKLIFNSSNSVVDDVTDRFNGYSIFKVDGQKLETENIKVYRSQNEFILEPENTTDGIFGATLYLIQKEHIVVLDNTTLFNDTIYDPETGYRQQRVKVLGYVAANWTGGFDIPGFIYDRAKTNEWSPWVDYNLGDIVKHKEFYYSAKTFLIGTETFNDEDWVLLDSKPTSALLPNWDYKAEQFTDFYDLDTDNFDAGQQKIAQHLIGYQKRQYLENIINNDVSQYKFYQGMIIEKGTQNVLNKLFDVLSADGQESLTFDEEWAFRVGEYGAVDTFNEIEFNLNENEFKVNPQPIELVDAQVPGLTDFVYRQTADDVYIKPLGYSKDIWPVTKSNSFLRSAGYVRKEDVRTNVDSLDDLPGTDISSYIEGDYVWTAFEGKSWNVYRFSKNTFNVENITNSGKTFTVSCDKTIKLSVGDIIGIKNTELLDGFYKVTKVALNTFSFESDVQGFTEFVEKDKILTFEFTQQRISTVDNLNDILPSKLKVGEIVWADDSGTGKWASYKNKGVYRRSNIPNSDPASNLYFGLGIDIAESGNLAAVADTGGVTIFEKGSADNQWSSSFRINADSVSETDSGQPIIFNRFGEVLKFSNDGNLLAVSDYQATVNGNSRAGAVSLYRRTSEGGYSYIGTRSAPAVFADQTYGQSIQIGYSDNNYFIAVSAISVDSTDTQVALGRVYVYTFNTIDGINLLTSLEGVGSASWYGYDIALTYDASILAVSAPRYNDENGRVYIYNLDSTGLTYNLVGAPLELNIDDDAERFGESIAISKYGTYLAVGSILVNVNKKKDVGQVIVYKLNNGVYELQQVINSPKNEVNERYGADLEFMNDDETLVVFSLNGDTEKLSTFDNGETHFDSNELRVVSRNIDTGRIDIYDRYNINFVYGESLENISLPLTGYGQEIVANGNAILVSATREYDNNYRNSGRVYSYVKPSNTKSWEILHEELPTVDINKIKKVFLYNTETSNIVSYLDVVDANTGKIPGIADQEIKFKTYFDPATYSIGSDAVNVDDGLNWKDNQVGMLWWNLTRAKFIDNKSGDVSYRTTAWNKLYDTASIDIYEWVKSDVLPSKWDKDADTEIGLSKGYSGQSLYGDSVYSVKRRYDNVSQKFKETYYFWVKNKKTIPEIDGRKIAAYDVSNLIADPVSFGYPCLILTGTNSFGLVNCERYLESDKINLTVQYWTSDVKDSNYHSEWKLLSTNRNTIIPTAIETKWFDSLIGKDSNDRVVPDINLADKQKYGIEFRPRQSMFVNRVEALKQVIERVNSVLASNLIADDYNLTALNSKDPTPSTVSRLWDKQIDTDAELRFVSTALNVEAKLTPIIINGRIEGFNIVNAGNKYGTFIEESTDLDSNLWKGPDIEITGAGRGAKAYSIVNSNGQIVSYRITEKGEGYKSDTTVSIRPYSVLVLSDSTSLDVWSIYSWDYSAGTWFKSRSQNYDVSRYWNYIDWYKDGYTEFTKIDFLVENTYELVTTEMPVGSIAKVRNVGTGGWLLLEKYADNQTIDYTLNFEVVGRQHGSIQFVPSIYSSQAKIVGFDIPLFDSQFYDNNPTVELRIILNALRDDILVDELREEYLKLFFASVRYALHEQTYVDWAFKTSFVKSQHNVGSLTQKVTYNSDNLEFFEEYIKEVKPYRTKVREYVSTYSNLEPSQTLVTDFDLLPVIGDNLAVTPLKVQFNDGELFTDYAEINTDPWKNWADNVGFSVTNLELTYAGRFYSLTPRIEISPPEQPWGRTATAKAYIRSGRIRKITLLDGGSGYLKAPRVSFIGGQDGTISTVVSTGRAVAHIGDGPVRSSKVVVKFDRISKQYELLKLVQTETFNWPGSNHCDLRWAANVSVDKTKIYIDNVEIPRSDYTLINKPIPSYLAGNFANDYTRYYGYLTFTNTLTSPDVGDTVVVTYEVDPVHMSATDRINFYYDPTTGQIGKDLAQLMDGVDYGGVQVVGLDFKVSAGWDADPWFTDAWDTVDPTFEDYIVTVSNPISESYRLPYVPSEGQEINVYVSRFDNDSTSETYGRYLPAVRIDDPNYNTVLQTNQNALMKSFVGDSEVDIIYIPTSLGLVVHSYAGQNYGDKIIFRKDTSDGSYAPRDDDFDTALSGGNLAYSTAVGTAPDDINLDGDDLISPNTSHAPEEVVPGHLMDSVAIKVYHRPSGGCPNIMFNTHHADGTAVEFRIGQHFPNSKSVIVKVDDNIKTLNADYTIDFQNNQIVFYSAPPTNSVVAILSVSFNSSTMLDLDYFVADGTTSEYLTRAPWLPNIASTVLVNGNVQSYELFSTDNRYTDVAGQTWRSRTGIRFEDTPPEGALISYMIDYSGVEQTSSIVKSENITYISGVSSYGLANVVGVNKPYEQHVLVKTGQTILKPPSANYFTMSDNNMRYSLRDYKYADSIGASDIVLYYGNNVLTPGVDYEFDFDRGGPTYGLDEATLIISGGEDYVVGDVLIADGGTLGPTGFQTKFEVIQVDGNGTITILESTDIGQYEIAPGTTFNLVGGSGTGATANASWIITADEPTVTVVLKSRAYVEGGTLVMSVKTNADYFINDDQEITFTNSYSGGTVFEILSFYNHNILGLERTVDEMKPLAEVTYGTTEYYELAQKLGGIFKLRSTAVSGNFVWIIKNGELLVYGSDYNLEDDLITVKLKIPLVETDEIQIIAFTNTVVQDSFAFMQFKDMLNRTHYKRLNKAKTTRLAKDLYQTATSIKVVDGSTLDQPNANLNLPGVIEINGERIEYFVKRGNTLSQLRRATLGTGAPEYHSKDSLVQCIGASETIPYRDDFVVTTHISDGISGVIDLPHIPNINNIEVFVGGYRMKKSSYKLHSNEFYPESPLGDITYPAEFRINGRAELELTTVPPAGVKVVVIKKMGKLWNDNGERLATSKNSIATFVKAVEATWQELAQDKYDNRVTVNGTTLSTGDGEPLEY